jgi:hypothetical protein
MTAIKLSPAVLALLLAFALGACGPIVGGKQAVCTSGWAAKQVKAAVFERAAAFAPAALRATLPQLAQASSLTLERPILVLVNHDTGRAVCEADAHLRLPAGVATTTPNPREVVQRVRYSSQPYANGRGKDFQLLQYDQMALGVAVADTRTWASGQTQGQVMLASSPGVPRPATTLASPAPVARLPTPPRTTTAPGSSPPPPPPAQPDYGEVEPAEPPDDAPEFQPPHGEPAVDEAEPSGPGTAP